MKCRIIEYLSIDCYFLIERKACYILHFSEKILFLNKFWILFLSKFIIQFVKYGIFVVMKVYTETFRVRLRNSAYFPDISLTDFLFESMESFLCQKMLRVNWTVEFKLKFKIIDIMSTSVRFLTT